MKSSGEELRFNIFSHCSDAEMTAFKECFLPRRLKKGVLLLREGDEANWFGRTETGALRCLMMDECKEHTVDLFCPGDFFGDYTSFFSKTPSQLFIETTADSVVSIASFDRLDKVLAEHPGLERVRRAAAEQVAMGMAWRVRMLLTEKPAARYRQLLSRRPEVMDTFPQYMIAQYLGMTPETLSRVRRLRTC